VAVIDYLCEHGAIENEILQAEHKKLLLQLPACDVIIDDEKSPLMVAMQRTTASVMKCFEGETRKIQYPLLYAK
jgi:CRISPR-associated protein Cas1